MFIIVSSLKFLLLSIDALNSKIEALQVYGVEFPVVTDSFTAYKQHKVQANTVKCISEIGRAHV